MVKSWADVVKIGVAKAQKKIDKPSQKTVVATKKITKKKPKPKVLVCLLLGPVFSLL